MAKPKYPVISSDPAIQRHYLQLRQQGMLHNGAEMLALQSPPGLQSDTRFMSGHVNHNQFADSPSFGSLYLNAAKRAGVSVEGAVYKHQLARFPGDPEAWVRSRGDVKRIVERRGMHCEGSVTHTPVEREDIDTNDGTYRVADDIVDAEMVRIEESTPGRAQEEPDLREKVTKRLSGED
jgi:hypothetical protein